MVGIIGPCAGVVDFKEASRMPVKTLVAPHSIVSTGRSKASKQGNRIRNLERKEVRVGGVVRGVDLAVHMRCHRPCQCRTPNRNLAGQEEGEGEEMEGRMPGRGMGWGEMTRINQC
eukprot:837830-Rhodomonas_salina.1